MRPPGGERATPSPSPTATRTSTPRATQAQGVPAACATDVRGEVFAVGSLDQRLAALRAFAAANSGRPAALVITDATLTDSARAQIAASGTPFEDTNVTVRPDGIRLAGTATAAFFRFPISAVLAPEVSGGQLRITVRDLQTGGLPSSLRDRVTELIGQAADPASWRLAMAVEDVVLRSGCGVVRGVARPT